MSLCQWIEPEIVPAGLMPVNGGFCADNSRQGRANQDNGAVMTAARLPSIVFAVLLTISSAPMALEDFMTRCTEG